MRTYRLIGEIVQITDLIGTRYVQSMADDTTAGYVPMHIGIVLRVEQTQSDFVAELERLGYARVGV